MFVKRSAKHGTITMYLFCWLSVFNELGKNDREVSATDYNSAFQTFLFARVPLSYYKTCTPVGVICIITMAWQSRPWVLKCFFYTSCKTPVFIFLSLPHHNYDLENISVFYLPFTSVAKILFLGRKYTGRTSPHQHHPPS